MPSPLHFQTFSRGRSNTFLMPKIPKFPPLPNSNWNSNGKITTTTTRHQNNQDIHWHLDISHLHRDNTRLRLDSVHLHPDNIHWRRGSGPANKRQVYKWLGDVRVANKLVNIKNMALFCSDLLG